MGREWQERSLLVRFGSTLRWLHCCQEMEAGFVRGGQGQMPELVTQLSRGPRRIAYQSGMRLVCLLMLLVG